MNLDCAANTPKEFKLRPPEPIKIHIKNDVYIFDSVEHLKREFAILLEKLESK